MVSSFVLSLKVIFPLIIFMGIGFIVRKTDMISDKAVKEMNTVVFRVLLSTMMFFNIYQSDLSSDFDVRILIYAVVSLAVMFLIAAVIIRRRIADKTIAPVVIQGIYRSNFVLFGLQVTASICGRHNLGMASVLISVIIPLYNILAVFLFETYRNGNVNKKALIKGITTNPLIIASVAGLLTKLFDLHFIKLIDTTLSEISALATPMSLILLGATITFEGLKKYKKYLIVCTAGRLIIVPAVFITLAVVLGFRGNGLVALMVMFASPTAVSSFPMATQMGGNSELAGQIVAVTTVFSTISIFIFTYILKFYGFI